MFEMDKKIKSFVSLFYCIKSRDMRCEIESFLRASPRLDNPFSERLEHSEKLS